MALKYFKVIMIMLFLVIICSCKKRIIDYRNKYCGTWDLNYQYRYNGSGTNSISEGKKNCKIYYNKRGPRDAIIINFSFLKDSIYTIERDGSIRNCGSSGVFDSRKKINFIFNSSNCISAGLGSSYSYTVDGTKN